MIADMLQLSRSADWSNQSVQLSVQLSVQQSAQSVQQSVKQLRSFEALTSFDFFCRPEKLKAGVQYVIAMTAMVCSVCVRHM